MPNHDPQAPAIELAHLTIAYEGSAPQLEDVNQIGRASCRERVCQYV